MIGRQIANYRVEKMLGQGGMGVVYKAVDVTLDRPVAVKVLSPELAHDPALIERFRAEAKAQANLNHTNVTTLYSFLNLDGNCLIVMEYVEGETLEQIIARRGPFPCQEAIPLFKQALLGIGSAHRMGIIHRDIKPANIMLSRDGIVKVMDFGIAKALGSQHLTRTRTQVGTIYYMSPEQIGNQPVDARSDIYSLGVTLFQMVTARLPFEGDSAFKVMSDHVNTPPPRPSRYVSSIPNGLDEAVLKALQKRPEARFQTVAEFGAALEFREGARAAAFVAAQPPAPARTFPVQRPSPPPAPPPRPQPIAPQPSPAKFSPAKASPPPAATPARTPQRVQRASDRGLGSTTAVRTHAQKFAALLVGTAILFGLLALALYKEIPEVLFVLVVLVYIFPILLAVALRRRDGASIVRLNLLRGWTGIGWFQAMKQVLSDDE